jgi:hypothetical protein
VEVKMRVRWKDRGTLGVPRDAYLANTGYAVKISPQGPEVAVFLLKGRTKKLAGFWGNREDAREAAERILTETVEKVVETRENAVSRWAEALTWGR